MSAAAPQSDSPQDPPRDPQSSSGADQSRAHPDHQVRSVEIGEETDTARGWHYLVRVFWEGGRLTEHKVELRWADHEHWSGGTKPPSRVLEAVVHVAAQAMGPTIPEGGLPNRFDASSLRRRVADLDAKVRSLL